MSSILSERRNINNIDDLSDLSCIIDLHNHEIFCIERLMIEKLYNMFPDFLQNHIIKKKELTKEQCDFFDEFISEWNKIQTICRDFGEFAKECKNSSKFFDMPKRVMKMLVLGNTNSIWLRNYFATDIATEFSYQLQLCKYIANFSLTWIQSDILNSYIGKIENQCEYFQSYSHSQCIKKDQDYVHLFLSGKVGTCAISYTHPEHIQKVQKDTEYVDPYLAEKVGICIMWCLITQIKEENL